MSVFLRTLGKRVLGVAPGIYDYMKGRKVRAKLLEEAKIKYGELRKPLKAGASWEDYVDALNKHLVSFREYYYSFEFWNKSEEERSKFISREATHLLQFRLRLAFPEYDDPALFWNKEAFLQRCQDLGLNRRQWLYSPKANREQISELLHAVDCIVKKHDSSFGIGIYKVHHDNEDEIGNAIEDCLKNENVIEECVVGCETLQRFHPASLNTLRIVTIAYRDKSMVFKAGFRTGRGGAVVDNTSSGGLYATIDPKTGIIITDALDYTGATHSVHPETGVQITGFQIPNWEHIVQRCNEAAKKVKGVIIIGWDICILPDGEVEFIEANHGPDFSGDKQYLLDSLYNITGKRFKSEYNFG